jgi:transposase-like protein
MSFRPSRCPRPRCPSLTSGHFRWQHRGSYRRRCDGRSVQRFICLECRRFFSVQTFRLDYRLKRPRLHLQLFRDFVSKVTHRQSARMLGCSRKTVAHRLDLLGSHCRDFHARMLQLAAARGGLLGTFQLDELETFEHSRRLAPLSVPVLIERQSYFVLHAEAVTLPARGGLSPADRRRKLERELCRGKRKSGSSAAVRRSFQLLEAVHAPRLGVHLQSDRKASYPAQGQRVFGARLLHERHSSTEPRDYDNPLFPINHTLAMMRDGISRLVRRNWAASKLRSRLMRHAWIWIAWRNYVRGITNKAPRLTPAMALAVDDHQWSRSELLAWRVLPNP